MRAKVGDEKRKYQVNIRLTESEVKAIDFIAMREDRDRAYIVTWFTRWCLMHYKRFGSLAELKNTKIISDQTLMESGILEMAAERLKLRQAASTDNHANNSGNTSPRGHKKAAQG